MTEKSLYQRRENQKEKFTPQAVTPEKSQEENMTEFVLEPLYTENEAGFRFSKLTIEGVESDG